MSRCTMILVLAFMMGISARAQYVYQTSYPDAVTSGLDWYVYSLIDDLRLTGLEIYLIPGVHNVSLFYGANPNGGSSQPWVPAGSATVHSNGMGTPTVIPIGLDVILPVQSWVRFRIVTSYNALGVDSSQGQNGWGQAGIHVDVGECFINNTTAYADFCGRIHYSDTAGGPRNTLVANYGPPLGGFLAPGVTFDIEARGQDVIVDGLQIASALNNNRYQLYTTEAVDSYANVPFNAASWRSLGASLFYSPGAGVTATIPIDFEVVVPKGKRRGFYLVDLAHGSLDTGNLNPALPPSLKMRSNADINLHYGELHSSAAGNFGAATNPGYINCSVRYRVPGRPSVATLPNNVLNAAVTANTPGTGIAFDLGASSPIAISSLNGTILKTASLLTNVTTTIDLWTTIDGASHVGQLGNAANWKKIGSVPAALPAGITSWPYVFIGLQAYVPTGGTRGFYLTTSSTQTSFQIQSGLGSPAVAATDGTLSLLTGELTTTAFVPGTAGHAPGVVVGYFGAGRADQGFGDEFENAGATQTSGWLALAEGGTSATQAWRFDNPGGRFFGYPMSGKTAMFDSNWSGAGNPVSGSLMTPLFDASRDLDYELHFDTQFIQGGTSQGFVEVWDGTTWNQIASYSSTQNLVVHEILAIGAAAGGCPDAMVRFRYQGNGDQVWILDNVALGICQKGQRPQLGIGEFDVENAIEPLHGQPVSCGLPGPYEATASIFGQTMFHWEGEPNQPIQLFAGYLNLGNVVLSPQGQLDVGSYDPMTGTFPGIYMLADGTLPDIFNAAFRTSSGGELTMPVYFPPYLAGFIINMQSVIFSSTQNIALTNVVTLTIN